MRQRSVKNLEEKLELNSSFLIRDPREVKGKWSEVFGNNNPIYLEIGCGKGDFVKGMAEKNPDVNFIAIEKVPDVCCVALEKAMEQRELRQNDNLRFIIGYAKTLETCVPEHSLDCIYLNFSDPWPKKGHAKRRLTYRSFLEIYKKIFPMAG